MTPRRSMNLANNQWLRPLTVMTRIPRCLLALRLIFTAAVPGGRYSGVATAAAQAEENPMVVENQQTGSNGWTLTMQGDDGTGQIKGYASATSVNQNQNITF